MDTKGILAEARATEEWVVDLRRKIHRRPELIHGEVEVDFRSEVDGKMHACGHDCHTAMLLGAARLLKEREQQLPGPVKLLFQSAEEGGAGGERP